MSKITGNTPKVFITPQAKTKMDLYIKHATGEISGLGTVDKHGHCFLIDDVFIFEQECSHANSDLSEEDIAKFLTLAAKDNLDLSRIKLFWHSHAAMGVFWSGTDEGTIDIISSSWMISIVGNKAGLYKTRLDVYDFMRLTIDDIELNVFYPEVEGFEDDIIKEIKEKVKPKSFQSYNNAVSNGNWRQGSLIDDVPPSLSYKDGERRTRTDQYGTIYYYYDKQKGVWLVESSDETETETKKGK